MLESYTLDIARRWANQYSLPMVDGNVSNKREAQSESLYNKKNNQETSANHHLFRAYRRSVFEHRDRTVRVGYFHYLLFGFCNGRGKQRFFHFAVRQFLR